MGDWHRVLRLAELPPGSRRVVEVEGVDVALFNVGGELLAVEDVCTHDGGPLAEGEVEGEVIVCPRHGARFSLRTGEVLAPPAYEPVARYAVRLAEGEGGPWIEVAEAD
ncbi:MAG: non-heme iron oxygenase ferredoxin subunit [Nitrospirae bacterium]|nr:MAG: non-heme iron oxygenase ferredoxin subunit [Nitrospirota bacterium]